VVWYALLVFKTRSLKLERIDTGDYTPDEYKRFLEEISFINRRLGDSFALQKTLLNEIERIDLKEFSVLDVGAGSGELLRFIAEFARRTGRKACLFGVDLNVQSVDAMKLESATFDEIHPLRGDALKLPFADKSVDYCISSLFMHHLTDEQVIMVLTEMGRVSRRGIFSIDLHRHPMAYVLYKIFCVTNRISPLVRQDGSLSILRSFKPNELLELAAKANLQNASIERYSPYRLVLFSPSSLISISTPEV
jgi:ubiquinone/menaquinone biosynthesis C-methylase UbiE